MFEELEAAAGERVKDGGAVERQRNLTVETKNTEPTRGRRPWEFGGRGGGSLTDKSQ